MNSFSCVITGHRPTRFKFKYNEKDKRCQRIKKCLQEQLIRLYNQGVRCFWVGGAMGADIVVGYTIFLKTLLNRVKRIMFLCGKSG